MSGVTVVSGPPCAGKTTYVRQHAAPGDLVLDFDALAVALGSPDPHEHPPAVAAAAHVAYRAVLREGLPAGGRAWIVQSRMPRASRKAWQRSGAAVVELSAEADELHRRATAAGRGEAAHRRIDAFLVAG